MPYEIQTTRHFERLFRKLDGETARQLKGKILELAVNPYHHKALTGELKGLYSMRVGDYRVIYTIEEALKKVRLLHVEHRRSVYR